MFRRGHSSEMRTPALLSVGMHVFALVAMIVNFDFFNRAPLEPEPIMVEFEAIAKKAAAPKIGIQDEQPKNAKIAAETTKAPPPPSKDPPPAPETPDPKVAEAIPEPPKPKEEPKAEKPKPVEDVIALKPKEPEKPKTTEKPDPKPDPKPEVKKVDPKPAQPPPKPQPKKDDPLDKILDSVLKNQDKNPPIKTPQQQPKPVKEITRQAAVAPNFSTTITASQLEAVREKIRPCWASPGGGKDPPVVAFVVQMNPDGTPASAEVKDVGRYNSDPVYRSIADYAWRAIMNQHCHPWPLPAEKYASDWHYINFNFDPRDY